MKKIYFLVTIFCVFNTINAQIINFPDANFKAKLLLANTNYDIATDYNGYQMKIDSNNDGEIQISEAQNVYRLIIQNYNLTNLSGIENFTNLIELNCADNLLTSLDVSNLTELVTFRCDRNRLNNLNVAQLSNLRIFYYGGNFLNNIDLTMMTDLVELGCNNNQITTLNINFLTNLRFLYCDNNLLTNIDIRNITYLRTIWCANNLLTDINLSNQVYIASLRLNNNLFLRNINIKNGQNFTYQNLISYNMDFSNCPNLQNICVNDSNLISFQNKVDIYGYTNCTVSSSCALSTKYFNEFSNYFTIYPNPVSNVLSITQKENITISSINIYNTLGQLVLVIPNAKNTKTIDVSSLTTGNYFIKINSDKVTSNTKFVKN
ncbi:T9SS type A sorting domain-containing protein [Flavobacterium sp.]|uniref:T9SS type A sorting domain-containing protein n=1 Tax=Flavobacterium sp. TaxID=239 RepID=UPI00375121A7